MEDAFISATGDLYITQQQVVTKVTTLLAKPVQVSVGRTLGACLDETGLVWMWGGNLERELGFGDAKERQLPCPLVALKAEKLKHVQCGGQFTVCIGDVKTKSSESKFNKHQTFGAQYSPAEQATENAAVGRWHNSSSGKSLERAQARENSSVKKFFSSPESELIYLRQKLLLASEQNKQILKENKSLKLEIAKELKPQIQQQQVANSNLQIEMQAVRKQLA